MLTLTTCSVLVLGARNSGKTSFINFLRRSLALPANKRPTRNPEELQEFLRSSNPSSPFVSHYLETEIDGERVGLTIWDSPGFEKNVVDLQLRELNAFIESKFEETFGEEQKVVRSPGILDTHIHCTFLILDPVRLDTNIAVAQQSLSNGLSNGKITDAARVTGGLDEDLDLQVLRMLQGKTTVVPVVSKADTITTMHMAFLKKTVFESLKQAGCEPLEVLIADEDETEEEDTSAIEEESENEDAPVPDPTPEVFVHDEEGNSETVQDEPKEAAAAEPGTPTSNRSANNTSNLSPPSSSVKRRHSRRISTSSISTSNSNNANNTSETAEQPIIPFSILSPDPHTLSSSYEGQIGRIFPWGFADPYNPDHCDFVKLKECVFTEWRAELREASREVWYERWRTSRLNKRVGAVGGTPVGNRQVPGRKRGIP